MHVGARQKLNVVYLVAIGIASGLVGLFTQSIVVFVICFGILAAAPIHNETIRPKPTKPTRHRS